MKLVLVPGCTHDIGASAFASITSLWVRTRGGRRGRPTHDSHLLGSLDTGCWVLSAGGGGDSDGPRGFCAPTVAT